MMDNINKFKLKGFHEFVKQYSRDNQLEIDRKYIVGSSDVPVIMDLNPYKSSTQLLFEKRSLITPEFSDKSVISMAIGKMMEDFITCLYLDLHSIDSNTVVRDKRYFSNYCLTAKYPNTFTAQCDLIIDDKEIFEIKNVSFFSKHWKNENDELIIPQFYLYQLYWQMMISNIKKANLLVYNNVQQQLYVFPCEFPDAETQKNIYTKCLAFVENLHKEPDSIIKDAIEDYL